MHLSWLRRKLGDAASAPRYITTVRGIGFRFEDDVDRNRSSEPVA
jgi:DNA-binding response OmpR family regulator